MLRCIDGPIRMTFKTVDVDSRIGVTAVAEVLRTACPRCIGRAAHMAVDAFVQAVLGGPDAFVHGLITVMQEVLHMVPAHVLRGLYAALRLTHAPLCRWHIRQE